MLDRLMHDRSTLTLTLLLSLTAFLCVPDAWAQQPPAEKSRLERLLSEERQADRRRSEGRQAPTAPRSADPLTPGSADLFTRSGAGLAGVTFGSTSIANVDGKNGPDLLVTGLGSNGSTLYLQQADGTFEPAGVGLTGLYGSSTSIADVDGKNGPDLLITGQELDDFTATLYLQQPDGTFEPAGAGLTGVRLGSTSIADVDGRNGPDLLIAGQDSNDDPTATLYLQQPGGTFEPADAGLTGVGDGFGRSSTSIADVDRKNGPDLLITGQDSNDNPTATLYLQQPGGTFEPAGADLNGVQYGSTSIANVDGRDGPDLLIAGVGPNGESATLYLQQADGAFEPAGAGLTGVGRFRDAASTSIADVDGQNGPDMLITGEDSNGDQTATLYLQQADDTFEPASAGLTGVGGFGGSSTSIADIDGDSDLDLLVTGRGNLFGSGSSRIYINRMVQNGSNRAPRAVGPRSSETPLTVERTPGKSVRLRVEFGDPDGDPIHLRLAQGGSESVSFTDAGNGTGELEVTPSQSQAGEQIDITVEATDGNGGSASRSFEIDVSSAFASARVGLTGMQYSSTSIADVDGQNGPDLLITGRDSNFDETATLYLQQPGGTFEPAGAGLTGVQNGSTSIADVDGQNGPDLLITGEDSNRDPTATLYLQQADGTFKPLGASLTGVGGFGEAASASITDVDGRDGSDLLITGEDSNGDPTATLYLQQPGGTFEPAGAGLIGVAGGSTSIADVDGQNGPDLLIAGEDSNGDPTVTLYLQQPDGTFTPADAGLTGVDEGGSTTIADVDGQNGPDLLITGEDSNGDPTATLYLQQPGGTFEPAGAGLAGVKFSTSTSIADVDGQNGPDLLITDGSGSATLYLQQSDGGFEPAGAGLTGINNGSTSIADIDGDGDSDLLVTGDAQTIANTGFLGEVASTLYDNLYDPAEAVATAEVPDGASGQPFFGTGVSIDFSSGTAGPGDARVVKYGFPPGSETGLPSSENIGPYRFLLETDSGVSPGSRTTVRFGLFALDGASNPGDIRVFRRNPPGDGFYRDSPGSSSFSEIPAENVEYDTVSGELLVTTSRFGQFVFTSDKSPLPVELSGLEAEARGEGEVRLTWQTASEQSNAGFAVQRKAFAESAESGPATWEKAGFVESKASGGTTSEARRYRFTDEGVPFAADSVSYRLRQVDTDGSASYSPVVTVERQAKALRLLGTSPNPARRRATLRYAVPGRQEVTIRLYDVLGRKVRTVVSEKTEGRREQILDLSGLASGTYLLRLTAGSGAATKTLTVVR
jgi:hypothetical protein